MAKYSVPPQAGMGISAIEYDTDGNLDIVKANFAGDTPSLYHGLGGWNFEDATFVAGRGCGFFDMAPGCAVLRDCPAKPRLKAEKVDLFEVPWRSGQVDTLKDIKPNQLIFVGEGIVRTMQFSNSRK